MVCWWDWGALCPWVKALALPPPLGGNSFSLALVGPGCAHHTHTSAPPHAGECGCWEWCISSLLPPQGTAMNRLMLIAHLGSHVPLEHELGMCRWEGSTCICGNVFTSWCPRIVDPDPNKGVGTLTPCAVEIPHVTFGCPKT